jgi:hypothetical protein
MSNMLTQDPTSKTPSRVIWETLIIDPRFQDRFSRTPGRKWHAPLWALVSGSLLITIALALGLILQ